VRRAVPASTADRLLRLWADRAPLLDALERLPQTLCHKDAWRRNMFAPPGLAGRDALMMIDWAYAGRGELGMDAGDLLGASYSLFGVVPCEPRELDEVVFENYLEGLYSAGWHGDRRAARFGYAAFAALKYGWLVFWLRDAGDERAYGMWERLAGRPMAEYVENQGRLLGYLLDLADEARGLLG
ncbi:MAG TPA: phosphotransferase, partial [Roseiflexaceae bacterium]|nr:phosphotransferase [Roseiflexaceae bacterium]